MNTIAALTRSNPAQAEEAIEDLADLFRVSLSDARAQITLRGRSRDRAHLPAHRAAAARRPAAGALGRRRPAAALRGAEPAAAAAARERDRARHRAAARRAAPSTVRGRLGGGTIVLEVTEPEAAGCDRRHCAAATGWRSTTSGSGWTSPSRAARPSKSTIAESRYTVRLRFPHAEHESDSPDHAGGHRRAAFVTARPGPSDNPGPRMDEDTPSPADRKAARADRRRRGAGARAAAPPARGARRRRRSSAKPPTAPKRSTAARRSIPTSCCSTCACRAWTASRPRATSARSTSRRRSSSRPPTTSTRSRRSRPQAVGYLLKPVRREKLARAVRHAARVAGPQLARLAEQSQLGRRRAQICARLGEQLRLVPVEDVLYFSADQKYVTVRHRGGQRAHRRVAARARAGVRAGLHPHPSQLAGRAPLRAGRRAQRRTAICSCDSRTATKPCRSAAGTRRRRCARSAPDTEIP